MQVYCVPDVEKEQPQANPNLPSPSNSAVRINVAGGELVAAIRFEGNATEEVCRHYLMKLKNLLEADGLQLGEAEQEGFFKLAQYGPLFSLATRLNEIWLTVKL